jgi:predicted Zn-dependent protease
MLRDAVRLDPSSWRAHEAYARYLILVRKLPEARAELAAAQAMAPNEVGPKRIAAQLDRAAGDTNAAIAGYTEVLKANPTSIPSLAGRADALIAQDKLAEAQADLTTAVKMNGHSQLAYLEALVLARQGKLSEASQLLLSANRFFRSFRVGYYLYGVIDYRLNLSENADSSLARFQAQQPNVSGVVRVRAQLAIQNRDLAGAIKLLSEFVKTNPADQNAVTMLARAYLINHQPDDVIALYEQLASAPPRQGPPEADPKTLIAIYGDAAGDLPAIEKVIMHEAPDVVPAMTALRQGDLDTAAQMAETLANSKPDDSWTQNLLGTVRLAQKRLPDAEAIFRRVLDKHPDFAASGFNLVQALVAQHRTDEAKLMLQDLSRRKLDDSVI